MRHIFHPTIYILFVTDVDSFHTSVIQRPTLLTHVGTKRRRSFLPLGHAGTQATLARDAYLVSAFKPSFVLDGYTEVLRHNRR